MSNFKAIDEHPMPANKLVLVKMGFSEIHLRRMNDNGDLFDDEDNHDDSEIDILSWCEIPD